MKQRLAPCQKAPSVSPPCHAKVTLLMAEICDPMSASEKPKVFSHDVDDAQNRKLVGT